MRSLRHVAALTTLALLGGCQDFLSGTDSTDPTNLTYSFTSDAGSGLAGVMLSWDAPRARETWSYAVYGRTGTAGEWYLVGVTTSTTFHDAGAPQRQYHVTARDEQEYEFGRSRTITIEYAAAPAAPSGLVGVSMNGAVHLSWIGPAGTASPSDVQQYRVFSTGYSAAAGCDVARWTLVGATTAPAFLVAGLTNGVSQCYAVSAVSRSGMESPMTRAWTDTPRHDARHVVVDAFEVQPASSGFIFHDVLRAQFGAVVDGSRADVDFRVERGTDGRFFLRAMRDAVRIAPYGTGPVADLTSVDVAPASGYTASAVVAEPGRVFVFRIERSDGIRFGAVRIAYTMSGAVVLDWAYQSAAGNPELGRGVR